MKAGSSSVSVSIDTLDDSIVFQPSDMIVASWPVRVGAVSVEVGDLVVRGTPLFELAENCVHDRFGGLGAAERAELEIGQRVSVDLNRRQPNPRWPYRVSRRLRLSRRQW